MPILQKWHIILDPCFFCGITKGWPTQLHVQFQNKKKIFFFSLLKNAAKMSLVNFYFIEVIKAFWLDPIGIQRLTIWLQSVCQCSSYFVSFALQRAWRTLPDVVSPYCCQITCVCCQRLLRHESTSEILRRAVLFRTVINAFCLISLGCLLGGLFHPNSSWPFKVGPSHVLNVFWQLLCSPPMEPRLRQR